jgi:aryl-alcohol dehydrogenase-like predicted oxidoreductase
MALRSLGTTGLQIPRLVFGGNVFGWTVDEKQSFSLLDALLERGFSAIDTADVYSAWAPGNKGGESETIIGKWFAAHPGVREKVTLFTKVGADLGNLAKRPFRAGLNTRSTTHYAVCKPTISTCISPTGRTAKRRMTKPWGHTRRCSTPGKSVLSGRQI